MPERYDYRNCQSLFGYAESAHRRSGGICQLCGCGAGDDVDFDLWRQLTVEHLIGESQNGYLKDIKRAVAERFPALATDDAAELARRIDEANTVTACSFCNSTTSRDTHTRTMGDLIVNCPGEPSQVLQAVAAELQSILDVKRDSVKWKLESVRRAFEERVEPELRKTRNGEARSEDSS